jgi:hypothetical protein
MMFSSPMLLSLLALLFRGVHANGTFERDTPLN